MALCPNSSVIQNAAVLRRRCDGFLGGKKSFPGVVNEGPPKKRPLWLQYSWDGPGKFGALRQDYDPLCLREPRIEARCT